VKQQFSQHRNLLHFRP